MFHILEVSCPVARAAFSRFHTFRHRHTFLIKGRPVRLDSCITGVMLLMRSGLLSYRVSTDQSKVSQCKWGRAHSKALCAAFVRCLIWFCTWKTFDLLSPVMKYNFSVFQPIYSVFFLPLCIFELCSKVPTLFNPYLLLRRPKLSRHF